MYKRLINRRIGGGLAALGLLSTATLARCESSDRSDFWTPRTPTSTLTIDTVETTSPTQETQPAPLLNVEITNGDTLLGIAARFCITLSEILQLNPSITDPDLIQPGQQITVVDNCLAAETTVPDSPERDQRIAQFISTYESLFTQVAEQNGLNKDIMLAQAILESGFGTSELAQHANNFFGMKANQDWTGLTYTKNTQEVIPRTELDQYDEILDVQDYPSDPLLVTVTIPAVFMAFTTPEEGFDAYARTIIDRFPLAVEAGSDSTYLAALRNGTFGAYATDPSYETKILNMLDDIRRIRDNTSLPPPAPTPTIDKNTPGVDSRGDQIATIDSIQLSTEGYDQFVSSIVDYTTQADAYPAYNMPTANVPEERKIGTQPGIAFVTLHYTAANYSGVDNFLESTNNSPSDNPNPTDTCCGPHFYIDQDGVVYQLGTFDERLRNNPPYDAASIGIEMEAMAQDDITKDQIKKAMYLIVYIQHSFGLDPQGLLGDTVYGHAETRELDDATMREWCDILMSAGYNEDNLNRCHSSGAGRTDWPKALMDHIRDKVYPLLIIINNR